MNKKELKKAVSLPWWEETTDTPQTEIVEENFYVEESFLKNKDLIRVDMNIVQFPIFSKNTKRKVNQIVKYYFNTNRDTYITVTPQSGDYIPGETEEKIFIALMQLMKERGLPKKMVISAIDLKNKVKFTTTKYNSVIDKSLSRLASTNYIFKNTLYSSEQKGILGEKIETSIFNIRTITLSKVENKKYREVFEDKRIKTVYEIEFSEHFYKNIIKKGYMVYNGEKLLEIDSSTARTIYMLVEKLRFDNLYLKLDTLFLIKRIPLKYSKKNIAQTIKTLEKSFQELYEKKLIKDFKIIKDTTWEKSDVEIFFYEDANIEKQDRFFQDRNEFRKLLTSVTVSDTEHKMLDEIEKSKNIIEVVSIETITELLNMMPSKAKTLKTMPKTIKEAVEVYGYEKVKKVAHYMKKNKVDKIRAYFIKALEENWVSDYEIIEEKPKLNFEKNNQIEELMTRDSEEIIKAKEYFINLSLEEQESFEKEAYKDYIKNCGVEGKIQKLAFSAGKKQIIAEYITKNKNFAKDISTDEKEIKIGIEETVKTEIIQKEEAKENIILTPEEFNEYINKNIELYRVILNLDEDKIRKIKIDILDELSQKFIKKELQPSEVGKVILDKLR